jgi:hypothetical protein
MGPGPTGRVALETHAVRGSLKLGQTATHAINFALYQGLLKLTGSPTARLYGKVEFCRQAPVSLGE